MNHEYDFSEILIGEDFAMYLKRFVQNEKITAKDVEWITLCREILSRAELFKPCYLVDERG